MFVFIALSAISESDLVDWKPVRQKLMFFGVLSDPLCGTGAGGRMRTSSGYSLLEMMVAVSLMGGVTVMTTEIMERVNRGVSSQEILNQSRNEAMVFFQRVHHASMTVLPDACADDMTARGVKGAPDAGAAQMNLSVNLGGNSDPEFILMNSCIAKPKGMKTPPLMSAQYFQDVVRKDAKRRASNRINYSASQCLAQMQVSCPKDYMPVTRLVYYGKDGGSKQLYFPRSVTKRKASGTVTSFACTFKEPGTGGPINVVLFAGHRDPLMQSKTESIVKWTSFRTVLPPRPTNAAYVRSPDVCSAMAPLPFEVTPGTPGAVANKGFPSGGGVSGSKVGAPPATPVIVAGGGAVPALKSSPPAQSAVKKKESELKEALDDLPQSKRRTFDRSFNLAKVYMQLATRARSQQTRTRRLKLAEYHINKAEQILGIKPERGMSHNDRFDQLKKISDV